MCVVQACFSPHYLASSGRWGEIATSTWEEFLDWLHETGLLTTKVGTATVCVSESKVTVNIHFPTNKKEMHSGIIKAKSSLVLHQSLALFRV
jgi:DNA gyrase inhibitor GyrI